MAVITRAYSETDGNIAYASSINKVIDDLYTLQNGNINSANLGTSVVGAGTIKDSAITTSKITDGAVTSDKIGTITFDKLLGSSVWETQQLILGGF
tara:strand:- start:209 stop:496 length:288 start_codon:yes stop_codon:yes gene_type:complete